MLRTCELHQGRELWVWSANSFHKKRKLFSNLSIFNCLRLAENDSCIGAAERTVNCIGDTINGISSNKVLGFGSCFKYKPDRHRTCFTMNSDRFVASSQRLLIDFVIPLWYCSHGNRSKIALRACSSSGLEKVSSLRLVFLLSSDDPGPWDPWDPAAVEPSTCSTEGQDRAEPDTFDAEAAYVSKFAHTCSEGAEILFHLGKSSRKISKCFRDTWIHAGHPIR